MRIFNRIKLKYLFNKLLLISVLLFLGLNNIALKFQYFRIKLFQTVILKLINYLNVLMLRHLL